MTLKIVCDECDEELDNVYASDLDPTDVRRMAPAAFQKEFDSDADPDASETPLGRAFRFAQHHRHDE